jgi:inhibitor of KinA
VSHEIAAAGDQALMVRFGDRIDPALGDRVLAALTGLDRDRPAGVVDVVPGYASLLVIYDPGRADPDEVRRWLGEALERSEALAAPEPRRLEIPVLYDGPDLPALAADKGLTPEALVALHAAPVYRCYLLGFRPGFPFLGGLDPRLAADRLTTPRLRVAAGSVGIGGRQTGIYPVASPGGWRLIGRTPVRIYDPDRPEPFLIRAGDSIRFSPVNPGEFVALGGVYPP